MSSPSIKDVNKKDYHKFHEIINTFGLLKEQTIYSIPLRLIDIEDAKGRKQQENLNIIFERGQHIEEVRRGMNKWASKEFEGVMKPDELWVHLGFYELLSEGMFTKMVNVKGSMTH